MTSEEAKKALPCYMCGDTDGEKDKFHASRCLKCKREQSRVYAVNKKQERLERKFLNGEKGIRFCECGNYYVSISGNIKDCLECRKSN